MSDSNLALITGNAFSTPPAPGQPFSGTVSSATSTFDGRIPVVTLQYGAGGVLCASAAAGGR